MVRLHMRDSVLGHVSMSAPHMLSAHADLEGVRLPGIQEVPGDVLDDPLRANKQHKTRWQAKHHG